MMRFTSRKDAEAAGYKIIHNETNTQFELHGQLPEDTAERPQVLGVAHYTLLGADGIDFDHTVVHPALRGTGLGKILGETALASQLAKTRKVRASCWYIAKLLRSSAESQS